MTKTYEHARHKKFILRYHIIFSTKYRKKLLGPISDDIKSIMMSISDKHSDWSIEIMEIDKTKCDHIHLLVRATPSACLKDIIHDLKQSSTYFVWKNHHDYLLKFYWSGKHNLWTRGYFCSSIGDVSSKTLAEYIKRQG